MEQVDDEFRDDAECSCIFTLNYTAADIESAESAARGVGEGRYYQQYASDVSQPGYDSATRWVVQSYEEHVWHQDGDGSEPADSDASCNALCDAKDWASSPNGVSEERSRWEYGNAGRFVSADMRNARNSRKDSADMTKMLDDMEWATSRVQLAVGETVTLMTPPFPSLLKHLLKIEGGAAE